MQARCCRRAMKIAALARAHAVRNPERAPATLRAVRVEAAVKPPAGNVDHVVQSWSRLILTDCNSESFRFPVYRSGRTLIFRQASMARCFSLKHARQPVAAAVAVDRAAPVMNSCAIVSAIAAPT